MESSDWSTCPSNTSSPIQPVGQGVIRTAKAPDTRSSRERIASARERNPGRENIVKVCKDYTSKDAIVVRDKAAKTVKPRTTNSCRRKLLPDVAHDFSGFTTQAIKEAMKKTVGVAEKVGD